MSLFTGTGVALVTPFTASGEVDYAALGQLVHSVIDGGVGFLVALGTTAETPALSAEERLAVLAAVKEACQGRVPIVCGIGSNSTQEALHMLASYPLAGVAGILTVVPYYNKPSQEGIYQHFSAIAAASPLPLILYNVPGRTVANMLPATVLRLVAAHSNIVAIKEASGNLPQCMELIRQKPEHFTVLSGDDNLVVAQMAIGMEGVISVAANSFPQLFCKMVNAARAGDFTAAAALQYRLLPGIDYLFAEGNPAGVKYALHRQGRGQNVLRLPLVPLSSSTAAAFEGWLQQEGLL